MPIESALVVLIPEAEDLVRGFRNKFDPSAAAGVPAHVTIVYPFKPPFELTADVIAALHEVFSKTSSFEVSFTGPKNTTQVTWTCLPAQLMVSSTNLNFGTLQPGIAATQTVQISNSGGRTLTWTANKGKASWLTLSKSSAKLASGGSIALHVTVNPKGMKAGTYSATVSINSNRGNVQIVVIVSVSANGESYRPHH